MELNDVLRKVRSLTTMAEHPATDPLEAKAAREAADKLMLKFAVDQAMLDASRPPELRGKPEIIVIDLCSGDLLGEMSWLAQIVASHCRCRIRTMTTWDKERKVWLANLYGYESDLRYAELLFTTLRLHMLDVLAPSWDDSRSLGENVYRLHNAGFNWSEIVRLHGWFKVRQWRAPSLKNPYMNKETGEIQPSNKLGAPYKRAYLAECRRLGTQPVQIPARGAKTWRLSAVDGYTSRIEQRLEETRSQRDSADTGALVLRRDDVNAFFREKNADLFNQEPRPECPQCKKAKSGYCRMHKPLAYKEPPFNAAAYQHGVLHANTADLGRSMGHRRGALTS